MQVERNDANLVTFVNCINIILLERVSNFFFYILILDIWGKKAISDLPIIAGGAICVAKKNTVSLYGIGKICHHTK